jgi:hypothetical protein
VPGAETVGGVTVGEKIGATQMRIARKLALLALTVAATMAIGTSQASALEVTNEATGQHCGGAVTCTIHANGTGIELGSPLGMIVCNNEFTGTVATEAGTGNIAQKTLTGCTPLSVTPCTNVNWPIILQSETSMEARFCVVVGGVLTVNCHVNIDINSTAGHAYTFRTGAGTPVPHRNCEQAGLSLAGVWATEATTRVEIKD